MRKFLAFLLSFVILISFSTFSIAVSKNNILSNEDNFKITLFDKTSHYEKVEMENTETGKIEYLESFLQKDGSYLYKATTGDKTYDIKNENGEISIVDNNGEISIISTEDIKALKLDENLNFDNEKYNIIDDKNSLGYCIPNTNWSVDSSGSSSIAIYTSDVSLIAGVIVSVVGGPLTGVITAIASWYASRFIENAYYTYKISYRKYNGWIEQKTHYVFYENKTHTIKIKDVYSPIRQVRFIGTPCN